MYELLRFFIGPVIIGSVFCFFLAAGGGIFLVLHKKTPLDFINFTCQSNSRIGTWSHVSSRCGTQLVFSSSASGESKDPNCDISLIIWSCLSLQFSIFGTHKCFGKWTLSAISRSSKITLHVNQIFLLEYTVAQPSRTELLRPLRVLVLDSPENLSESSHEVIIKCMKSTKIPTAIHRPSPKFLLG